MQVCVELVAGDFQRECGGRGHADPHTRTPLARTAFASHQCRRTHCQVRVCVRALCACVHACVRACVCMRACMRACVHACVRACVRLVLLYVCVFPTFTLFFFVCVVVRSDAGRHVIKSFNILMLKVLENSDRTSSFYVLLRFLTTHTVGTVL